MKVGADLVLHPIARLRRDPAAALGDVAIAGLVIAALARVGIVAGARLGSDPVAYLRLGIAARLRIDDVVAGLGGRATAGLGLDVVARLGRASAARLRRAAAARLGLGAVAGLHDLGAALRPQRALGIAPDDVVVLVEILGVLRTGPLGLQRVRIRRIDLRIGKRQRDVRCVVALHAARHPRVGIVAIGGGGTLRRRGDHPVGPAERRIGHERLAGRRVGALRPVAVAPLAHGQLARQVDVDRARRPRVGRHLGPGAAVGDAHAREARAVGGHGRQVGERRVVIQPVECAVVHRRRPHAPVFVQLAALGRGRRVALDTLRHGVAGGGVDASRATRRKAGQVAACSGTAVVVAGRIARIGNLVLLGNVAGRKELAVANGREVVGLAGLAADRAHLARAVPAVGVDHVIGQKIEQHGRRVVHGEHDVRLGGVANVQGLVRQRREAEGQRVGRCRQGTEAEERGQESGEHASEAVAGGGAVHVVVPLARLQRSIACRKAVVFFGPSTRTVRR